MSAKKISPKRVKRCGGIFHGTFPDGIGFGYPRCDLVSLRLKTAFAHCAHGHWKRRTERRGHLYLSHLTGGSHLPGGERQTALRSAAKAARCAERSRGKHDRSSLGRRS